MANPLTDIQRAVGSLAILPDIGRQIARMAKDVRLMREAVQALPLELQAVRASVEALHVDMNRMVDDVGELKGMQAQLDVIHTDLKRLPFVGGGRRGRAKPDPAVGPDGPLEDVEAP